ncbi:hypothetical protein [Streptomyces sp. NRRL F-5727]|uniref:hypothetical protein n=1 Tax=Streptomyces sp. NRRL F-5727 TaxID=1463871 RepID=UPI00099C8BEF|nr:hypothetical protein [Streptomyces sp. NRRL F-5727]
MPRQPGPTDHRPTPPRPPSTAHRLDEALSGLSDTFRGMTAHPDEYNCPCHWGSAEELARLKTADVELDADLLRRTWEATDWTYRGSVLRRILPQLAAALVSGSTGPDLEGVGRAFAMSGWRAWPAEQTAAVEEFLHAWWTHTLTTPAPTVPAHQLLVLTAEATGTMAPWLAAWEATPTPEATRHLAEAIDHWDHDLLADRLPWSTWEDEEEWYAELTTWLVRHAPARLRAHGAPEDLLHRVRLLGLTGPARWEDPHMPDHRY